MPRITNLNRLILGEIYYIIVESQWADGLIDLDYLKICAPLRFVDITNRNDEPTCYHFIDPLYEDDPYELHEYTNFFIFTKIDAYYKYIQDAFNKRGGYNLRLSSEVKELFKKSQDINPEEWI